MKLTVGILAKNEADRYIKDVVKNVSQFADSLVVLDDGSTDNTVQVIKDNATIPVNIRTITDGDFGNEIRLRKELYQMVLDENPDWYMIVDADEIYHAKQSLRTTFDTLMLDESKDAWAFRLYDMWSETHFRADSLWGAHNFFSLMLVRNVEGFVPEWKEQGHHCGRIPVNTWSLRTGNSEHIRIKHMGWAREDIRQAKYERYMKYDGDGKYGSLEQYASILDPNPNLVKWVD